MRPMRRKLRLALLIALTGMSGVCGLLLVMSHRWLIYIGHDGPTTHRVVFIRPSSFGYQSRPNDAGAAGWFLTTVPHDWPWPSSDWSHGAGMRNFQSGAYLGPNGTTITVKFPLWVPLLAFGLWPGIVAVKVMRGRRRRQQASGFDVAPAKDATDAA
jgi:hypothetical protein